MTLVITQITFCCNTSNDPNHCFFLLVIWVASTYMASISVAEEVRDGGEIARVRDRDRESGKGRWGKKGYGEGRE